MQYDVNQTLIKSNKSENETMDDVDSVFNASIPSDECVSEWSGAANYEDTEFDFEHLEGMPKTLKINFRIGMIFTQVIHLLMIRK